MSRRKKKRTMRKPPSKHRQKKDRHGTDHASVAVPGMGTVAQVTPDEEEPAVEEAVAPEPESEGRLLLVDDNARYRTAFKRHLVLEGFEVDEAADAGEALQAMSKNSPEVLITDLAMRTETEGLDLIREAKLRIPLMPVIMISAVGTFEEGAEASRLGAVHVVSKMRIDAEMPELISKIRRALDEYRENRELLAEIEALRERHRPESEARSPEQTTADLGRLRQILASDQTPAYLKSEAYEALMGISSSQLQQETERRVASALREGAPSGLTMDQIDEILEAELPGFAEYDVDTRQALRTAEFLYNQESGTPETIDFSRNIGFSYCFAVENEAKVQLRRRLQRFLSERATFDLIPHILERDKRHINLFFHQHLLQVMRGRDMDVTIDNVRQTLMRMMEHTSRYKPDGLKALGILLICFGRSYSFYNGTRNVFVDNPLGIQGLKDDHEVMDFAELLISLQHYRNPYIHPEISEMEKISKIRRTTFDCLDFIYRIK